VWSVRLSVGPSVTLVHHAEADERNEMSFGRDTRVWPQVTLSQTGVPKTDTHGKERFGVESSKPN